MHAFCPLKIAVSTSGCVLFMGWRAEVLINCYFSCLVVYIDNYIDYSIIIWEVDNILIRYFYSLELSTYLRFYLKRVIQSKKNLSRFFLLLQCIFFFEFLIIKLCELLNKIELTLPT